MVPRVTESDVTETTWHARIHGHTVGLFLVF